MSTVDTKTPRWFLIIGTFILICVFLVKCSSSSTDPSYRTEREGWIFVHIEGTPSERGYQYGSLVAQEIDDFITVIKVYLE